MQRSMMASDICRKFIQTYTQHKASAAPRIPALETFIPRSPGSPLLKIRGSVLWLFMRVRVAVWTSVILVMNCQL